MEAMHRQCYGLWAIVVAHVLHSEKATHERLPLEHRHRQNRPCTFPTCLIISFILPGAGIGGPSASQRLEKRDYSWRPLFPACSSWSHTYPLSITRAATSSVGVTLVLACYRRVTEMDLCRFWRSSLPSMAMGCEVRKSGLECLRLQERAVGWRHN